MAPQRPEEDKKKSKKDKKEKKRSETEGVKKSKSEKKEKKEKKRKAIQDDDGSDDGNIDAEELQLANSGQVPEEALVPFANPLANESDTNKILNAVKLGALFSWYARSKTCY